MSPTAFDPYRGHNAPDSDGVIDGTVDEVLAWVGDDPQRAARAIAAEEASDRPRKGIVEGLADLAAVAVPDGTVGDVVAWVDDDPERAERAVAVERRGRRRKGVINGLAGLAADAPLARFVRRLTDRDVDESTVDLVRLAWSESSDGERAEIGAFMDEIDDDELDERLDEIVSVMASAADDETGENGAESDSGGGDG